MLIKVCKPVYKISKYYDLLLTILLHKYLMAEKIVTQQSLTTKMGIGDSKKNRAEKFGVETA